ncbi:hypothetical protein VTL71DRAFT_13395 [Oculimacula yallundae]|uniref:Uncharacterized protein n=1 Tax=Oculimacula yallundae TaxID=86028 RepID=A0ABR4CMJ9_9HELO
MLVPRGSRSLSIHVVRLVEWADADIRKPEVYRHQSNSLNDGMSTAPAAGTSADKRSYVLELSALTFQSYRVHMVISYHRNRNGRPKRLRAVKAATASGWVFNVRSWLEPYRGTKVALATCLELLHDMSKYSGLWSHESSAICWSDVVTGGVQNLGGFRGSIIMNSNILNCHMEMALLSLLTQDSWQEAVLPSETLLQQSFSEHG